MHKDTTASYSNIQELAQRLKLSPEAYQRALETARLIPDRMRWLRYIDRFLVVVGVLLIVAGTAAFFAWNWADLGRFIKFALIEGGLVAAVILVWQFGLNSAVGRISLFAAAFLTGILLAVFGQVYQTGADPYGLFLTWAILILPWAVIGRQVGIWLLLQILLNLTVIMYYTQVLRPPDGWWQLTQLLGPLVWLATTVLDSTLASILLGLNVLALLIWELVSGRGIVWMQGRLFPRLLALTALLTSLIPTIIILVAAGFKWKPELNLISPVLFFAVTGIFLVYYRHQHQDLFILTASLLAVIMLVTSLVIRYLTLNTVSLFFMALLVIAEVATAAWWLRKIAHHRSPDS